jgi:cell division protein FtsQ
VIDERIAQRRAEIRDEDRRRRLRRTVTAAVALLLVVVVVVVESSPLVGLEEVQVHGTVRSDPDDVRAAADLDIGTSTLRLRLRAAARRVEQLPLVREASARRVDPLTVVVEVREREPALTVRGEGTQRRIDRDGVVILEGGQAGLPEVRLSEAPPAVGEDAADEPALANAVAVWRGLSGPLRADVQRYVAQGPDTLTLVLTDGTRVRFGRAERIDEKIRALGAVLGDLDGTSVDTIDVRAPSAPVVIGAP